MGTAANLINAQAKDMTPSTEFAGLYERHYAAVYRTALRVTGNRADAEDVLQTVFLRVLKNGGRVDAAYAAEAYFRRAAANAALDLLRRRGTRAEVAVEEADSVAAKESPLFLKERLRRALAVLDPEDALLFFLRYVEGISNGELAEMFGQEKNNIAVRLHRIRQNLQTEIDR